MTNGPDGPQPPYGGTASNPASNPANRRTASSRHHRLPAAGGARPVEGQVDRRPATASRSCRPARRRSSRCVPRTRSCGRSAPSSAVCSSGSSRRSSCGWSTASGPRSWTAPPKEALNFQLTLLIGYVVSFALACFLIGFILLPIVWIVGIVFMIMGAIAVSKFEDYRYPVNIRFIK